MCILGHLGSIRPGKDKLWVLCYLARWSLSTYVRPHFIDSSPSQCWHQAVMCVSTPRIYPQRGYFLVLDKSLGAHCKFIRTYFGGFFIAFWEIFGRFLRGPRCVIWGSFSIFWWVPFYQRIENSCTSKERKKIFEIKHRVNLGIGCQEVIGSLYIWPQKVSSLCFREHSTTKIGTLVKILAWGNPRLG